jgi:predicted short-subunit dehydrogenase-like oxidoreductase (DUF2520 family)
LIVDGIREEVRHHPIAIIGTGRIARALGTLLPPIVSLGESRHILIAVADDAIPAVASKLAADGLRDAVVLHTSGAAGPEALRTLRDTGNAIGVLHPLQTVPTAERGIQSLPGATYAFAGDPAAVEWAGSLVARLGGKELAIDPRRWHHYHAAAVMACNYQVTLMDAALELMETAGLRRATALEALAPILRATTENILASGPEKALTGPIVRGDVGTIRRHLASLETAFPETRRLYVAAGQRTIPVAKRAGLPDETACEIARALATEE